MAKLPAIKFGTDGWRAVIARDFTFDNLARVTEATGLWLAKDYADKRSVFIGYDCRFLGPQFARAVANQLAQMGVQVFLAPGFVSTPMVSLATMQRQLSAGIVLTASHNPPEYNGFKIKGSFGGPAFPSMISAVEALIPGEVPVYEDRFDELVRSAKIQYYDAEALYLNHVRQSFDLEAIRNSGIKMGYDAMYGAGQVAFRKLLPHATSIHADYNPSFLGQAPEPIERNLKPFQELIRSQGLQWGLATDGDADRIGLFDEQARFVDSHHILLLLIHYLHKYKNLKGKVVYTFSCTDKIRAMCETYGIPYEVTKIGFKYIGEIMAREEVLVGGEESGGIAVTGHAPERDGIYIGLMVLEFMAKTGKSLTQLVDEVYDVVGSFAVERIDKHLPESDKQAVLAKAKAGQYKQFGGYQVARVEDLDSYKLHFGGAHQGQWVMIRPSGTEPLLRIYAEAPNRAQAEAILQAVEAAL